MKKRVFLVAMIAAASISARLGSHTYTSGIIVQ